MHWKLSSSRKFGLQIEFFTHGELLQGFCIRKKKISISFLKNAAGCLLSMANQQFQQTCLEICRDFQFNNALAAFNVFFRFSFISQLISVTQFRGMKYQRMEVFYICRKQTNKNVSNVNFCKDYLKLYTQPKAQRRVITNIYSHQINDCGKGQKFQQQEVQ